MSLEIKKKIKRLNFCLLKNFETKMTNLTLCSSSVGGGWGRTPMHIHMTGMLVGKLEFKNLAVENIMDIAQARLRLYSVTH